MKKDEWLQVYEWLVLILLAAMLVYGWIMTQPVEINLNFTANGNVTLPKGTNMGDGKILNQDLTITGINGNLHVKAPIYVLQNLKELIK